MSRTMYDFTHENVAWFKAHLPNPGMVAWYGTGSPGIQWTTADRAMFPNATMLEIDQGGSGSPILTAHIRDVENGAWSPGRAVDRTGWNVEFPTIYGSRSSISQVIADGWRGDVWLASPGWSGTTAPSIPGVNVVAVQNNWQANYDSSIVFDDTWYPAIVPVPGPSGLKVTITQRRADIEFPVIANADHYVVHYQSAPGVAPVVIDRSPQPVGTTAIVLHDWPVPDGHAGIIYVDGIVHSMAVRVGTVDLP